MDTAAGPADAQSMRNDQLAPIRDVWYLGSLLHLRATGADTGGAYAIVDEHLRRGFATPEHVHRREDEAFLVLDGTLTFRLAGDLRTAGAGEYVFLPRTIRHAFCVDSPSARVLNVVSPAGFENFFADAGEPATGPGMPPQPTAPPDVAQMASLLAEYGVELLGPPPFSEAG